MIEIQHKNKPLPFLKWVGGKRWLTKYLQDYFPTNFEKYIEPFLGSGAVFYWLQPEKSILADTNLQLIETYRAIKNEPGAISRILRGQKITKNFFLNIRRKNPTERRQIAARLIYLNRTAFNGIYRVNLMGLFNVPFGCKKETKLPSLEDLKMASVILKKTTLLHCDFEVAMKRAGKGDLIYADPPYTVRHTTNGFLKYNKKLFSWQDQKRLAKAARAAVSRGANVFVSNAPHKEIIKLYWGFQKVKLTRMSSVAADEDKRGSSEEILFYRKAKNE